MYNTGMRLTYARLFFCFFLLLQGCDTPNQPQSDVVIYSSEKCPSCRAAKTYLSNKKIEFVEKNINESKANFLEFKQLPSRPRTVPQILIDGQLIGGWDELKQISPDNLKLLVYRDAHEKNA